MNNKNIITGLIIALVVSLMVASVYAAEVDTHTDNDTTNHVDGLYISGSGNVAHVSESCPNINHYIPDSAHAVNI